MKYSKRSDRLIMRWSASKNFLYVKRDKRPQFEQWWKEEEEWRGENKIIRFKQPILISLESHSEKLRMKRIFYFHFYSFSISLSLSPQIRFVRHHWLAISWGCEIIFNCQRENTIKNLNSAHPYRRHYRATNAIIVGIVNPAFWRDLL